MKRKSDKKTAIIALASIAAIGILIAVISVLSKSKKPGGDTAGTPTPTSGAAETPTPTESVPNGDPTPTPVHRDYSGETIEFTNDMPDIVFSHAGSFYKTNLEVRLYSRFKGDLYYTLDGTHPTKESTKYDPSQGISLTANKGNIPKFWSLRVAAFYEDGTKSAEFVHTYILGSHVDSRYQTMVFAINGDPAELTDEPDGILYGENYENRGRESERAVYLEVIEPNGTLVTEQNCGVRVYGAYSRRNSQKSMKFYARKLYSPESGTFYLNCLDLTTADGSATQVVRYDKFVLRASGNDYRFAFVRDELNQMLAEDAGFVEHENVCPAVCYINGEYFGFFWVHSSYCDTYLKNKYGDTPAKQAAKAAGAEEYTEGEFVVLEGGDAFKKTEEGDDFNNTWATAYDADYYRFAYGNLTDDKLYRELQGWMDVEDYLSYMAYNIYLCNKDWPHNNYKCFRYVPAEGESLGTGAYDGRWRYLLHDIDYTYGLYDQQEVLATYDTLRAVLTEGSDRYAPLLAALLARPDCLEYFVKASLDFANGALSFASVSETLAKISENRASEMTYYYNFIASLGAEDAAWVNESQLQGQLQTILDFAQARPTRAMSHLKSRFLLGSSYTLDIPASNEALIRINSYTLPAGKRFSGMYFTDFATEVSATVRNGFLFDYWEVNGQKRTQQKLTLTERDISNGQISVVLHVKENPASGVVIETIRARGEDYLVLRNFGQADADVSGYRLTDGGESADGTPKVFSLPAGSVIPAGGTLRIDCVKTNEDGTPGDDEGGKLCPFRLSKGDTLTLSDASGRKLQTIAIPNLHSGFVYRRNAFTGEFREERE